MLNLLILKLFTLSVTSALTEQLNEVGDPFADQRLPIMNSPASSLQCTVSQTNLGTFSSMFKTPEQQAEFEKQYYSRTEQSNPVIQDPHLINQLQCVNRCLANPRRWPFREAFYGPADQLWERHPNQEEEEERKKRQVPSTQLGPTTLHCCCVSQQVFIRPLTASNVDGQFVTLAQFRNRSQFFSTETCNSGAYCSGCKCRCEQKTTLVSAVVVNRSSTTCADFYTIEAIEIPGCCKCTNRGTPYS